MYFTIRITTADLTRTVEVKASNFCAARNAAHAPADALVQFVSKRYPAKS